MGNDLSSLIFQHIIIRRTACYFDSSIMMPEKKTDRRSNRDANAYYIGKKKVNANIFPPAAGRATNR
jgi:hypothetical protein